MNESGYESNAGAKEVLVKARAKIEQGWTQGTFARNGNQEYVYPTDSDAVSWCVRGAICVVVVEETEDLGFRARRLLASANQITEGLAVWNDTPGRTQAEVLAAFDKAIAAAP
jgi:hypothetical protein